MAIPTIGDEVHVMVPARITGFNPDGSARAKLDNRRGRPRNIPADKINAKPPEAPAAPVVAPSRGWTRYLPWGGIGGAMMIGAWQNFGGKMFDYIWPFIEAMFRH